MIGEIKASRMRELALRERIPLVWLIDSAGARIQEAAGSMFARTGDLFREQVHMSGVIPQVAAMVGPGAAGTAYIPGLADFVPMVKGTSNMALGGTTLSMSLYVDSYTRPGPYTPRGSLMEIKNRQSSFYTLAAGTIRLQTAVAGTADLTFQGAKITRLKA